MSNNKIKKEGKDKGSIKSSTTPDPGYQCLISVGQDSVLRLLNLI